MTAPSRPWWRRNAVALAVLVVAVPAAAFVLSGLEIIERDARQPTVRSAGVAEPVVVGGYEFELVDSAEFVGTGTGDEDNGIPTGMTLVAALIDITPTADAAELMTCTPDLVGAPGSGRSWPTLSSPAQFRYGVGEESSTLCTGDDEPAQLEVVYLTPAGAYDGSSIVVDITADGVRSDLELRLGE